jgi:hypothetical protein
MGKGRRDQTKSQDQIKKEQNIHHNRTGTEVCLFPFNLIADRYKLGYCEEHYEKITGDVAEKETKVPKHKRRRMKKAKKFTVFDKLNDPSEFTGFHVHRFDNMG